MEFWYLRHCSRALRPSPNRFVRGPYTLNLLKRYYQAGHAGRSTFLCTMIVTVAAKFDHGKKH